MESFSAIKKRMKSVNDISQMTNAMQLVSSAKMRRSQLLHDSMYPFFLFCAGCAMAFSFSKFNGLDGAAVRKIVRRGLLIFLVGLLCNLYPFFPTAPDPELSFWQNWVDWIQQKRVFGVLQRIGMSYLIAGIVAMWLRKPGKILAAIAVLSIVYTGILVIFGTDPGPFTLEGNVSGRIDVAVAGEIGRAHV